MSFDLSEAIFGMVLNKITEPSSKRRVFTEWREEHSLEGDSLSLHHYYRALDYLVKVKESLEDHLFSLGRNLFSGVADISWCMEGFADGFGDISGCTES